MEIGYVADLAIQFPIVVQRQALLGIVLLVVVAGAAPLGLPKWFLMTLTKTLRSRGIARTGSSPGHKTILLEQRFPDPCI